jgi:hypothetical protein
MYWNHITHNIVRITTSSEGNQHLFSDFHLTTFIKPLQSIWLRMLYSIQIQFLNKSSTTLAQLSPLIIIFTYLVLNITSNVKDVPLVDLHHPL